MREKTVEAAYRYFHLDRYFSSLEERYVPKQLRKLQPIAIATKTLLDGKIVYTWNF